jgi:hypothetical protein
VHCFGLNLAVESETCTPEHLRNRSEHHDAGGGWFECCTGTAGKARQRRVVLFQKGHCIGGPQKMALPGGIYDGDGRR